MLFHHVDTQRRLSCEVLLALSAAKWFLTRVSEGVRQQALRSLIGHIANEADELVWS